MSPSTPSLDRTHDPKRQSFVASANKATTDFPLQNLPFGVFSVGSGAPRVGVAIGDLIVDLSVLESEGLVRPDARQTVFDRPDINAFMGLGRKAWTTTRQALSDLLDAGNARLRDDKALLARAFVAQAVATLHLPLFVRSFTDFYASRDHATNVGAMLRDPANALTPNWLHVPIGYNGRASTVVVSGTPVRRPLGQTKPATLDAPVFGPSRRLDFELELGAIVGTPSTFGHPLTVAEAQSMIFGYVMLNDWSARDVQGWEYVPLGPFQSKAFATTISPWVVTTDALEPYRVAAPPREKPLLPYLTERTPNTYDIALEVELAPTGGPSTRITRSNARNLYYSSAQQLAHHAVGGCAMMTGDLLGTGTISGPTKDSRGSLLELAWGGKEPLTLTPGVTRSFLDDGDTVTFTGWCQGHGHRIGFGRCTGTILPAPAERTW